MATAVEDIQYRANPMLDIARGIYSWQTIEMLSRGASQGYYVPGLGGVGKLATYASRKFGYTGTINTAFKFGATEGLVGRYANKLGVLESWKKFHTVKSPVLRVAVGKNMISRVAGFGIKAVWWQLGIMVGGMALGAWNNYATRVQTSRGLELGGHFPTTRDTVTARQRTLKAITSSRLQARSAIGNEAMLFHR